MKNEFIKRLLTSFLILPLAFFFIIKGSFFFTFFLSIVFLVSIYEWIKITKNFNILKITGVIFIFFSIYTAYLFRNEQGVNIFLFIIVISIFTDLGGYIFGKIFKGRKLTKISPNKTISGALGSIFCCCSTISFLIYYLTDKFNFKLILIGIIISIICQLGDIFFSFLKRKSKIKDTGKFLPGHGGVLDRLDGILIALPIGFITLIVLY